MIVVVMSIYASVLFVQEQRAQTNRMYQNAYNFSELVSTRIVDHFQAHYLTGNYVRFQTLLAEELEKNTDIADVVIADYLGNMLYHYETEATEIYSDGEVRQVSALNNTLLERIQGAYPSVETKDGQVLYVEVTEEGVRYVDAFGVTLDPSTWVEPGEEVVNIVRPLKGRSDDHRYAIYYEVSYGALHALLVDRAIQTVLLALLFISTGILVAYFFAMRVVNPIVRLTQGVSAMSKGELGKQVDVRTNDEVGLLAGSFNKMSKELKDATDALIVRERLAKEVELASKIQQEFLPQVIPSLGHLDIAAGVRPADAVGGDCYDFVPLDEHRMLFFIGDVTGHGVSAGLITAIANSIVYSLAHNENISTKEIAKNLNRVLRAKTRPDMFITMFIGLWDSQTQEVHYTPAGHEPTYVYKKSVGELQQLKKEGIALGLLDEVDGIMQEEVVSLHPGDTLIFYSDGIPEAWSKDRVMYDFERFEASIMKHIEKPRAQEVHDALIQDVYDFMGDAEQQDDITLIVFRLGEE